MQSGLGLHGLYNTTHVCLHKLLDRGRNCASPHSQRLPRVSNSVATTRHVTGASTKVTTKAGNTALHYAVHSGMLDLTKFLVLAGADVHHKNAHNREAFDYADEKCGGNPPFKMGSSMIEKANSE